MNFNLENREGGNILNNVLIELLTQPFFAELPLDAKRAFAKRILYVGSLYHCPSNYILGSKVGSFVGLCAHCVTDTFNGEPLCAKCHNAFHDGEYYDVDKDEEGYYFYPEEDDDEDDDDDDYYETGYIKHP